MEKKHALTEPQTLVARERFELSSRAPEAPMLDRYTTGLQPTPTKHGFYIITLVLRHAPLFLEGFSDAVAFLADWGPLITAP
jgi:hypothetical protein